MALFDTTNALAVLMTMAENEAMALDMLLKWEMEDETVKGKVCDRDDPEHVIIDFTVRHLPTRVLVDDKFERLFVVRTELEYKDKPNEMMTEVVSSAHAMVAVLYI